MDCTLRAEHPLHSICSEGIRTYTGQHSVANKTTIRIQSTKKILIQFDIIIIRIIIGGVSIIVVRVPHYRKIDLHSSS